MLDSATTQYLQLTQDTHQAATDRNIDEAFTEGGNRLYRRACTAHKFDAVEVKAERDPRDRQRNRIGIVDAQPQAVTLFDQPEFLERQARQRHTWRLQARHNADACSYQSQHDARQESAHLTKVSYGSPRGAKPGREGLQGQDEAHQFLDIFIRHSR